MNDVSAGTLPGRDLVLIGAGHTNLHVVRMWRMRPIDDVRATLVSPFSRATYSGMLPGTLAGLYRPDDMEIDLWRLCESCGVRLIVDEAVGFEPDIGRVLLANRPPLRFDAASIGIGSVPGQRYLYAAHPNALSIKPMATFRDRFEQRLSAVADAYGARSTAPPATNHAAAQRKIRITIVGAGAGGTEVALALEAQLRARGLPAEFTLIDGGTEILHGYTPGTIRRARREFSRRGVEIRLGKRVVEIRHRESERAAALVLDDGLLVAADIVVWATAAAPPSVLDNFRLPKSADGFLEVHATLQTTADLPVFAVGDTASIVGHRIPRAGVYAVREGPVLWDNLQRLFSGRPLRPFKPQRGFLSLLSTGDGRAILDYRGFSAHGRLAWRLKDHIDRKFMRMYQDYRPRPHPRPARARRAAGVGPPVPPSHTGPSAPMRCAGCGSKVGAVVLSAALERLDLPSPSDTSPNLNRRDDAVVLDRQVSPIDVLSVDFFPAFLDDPYLVGRISALHALSDVWAMGADPVGALALVTLPAGPQLQQTELLYQMLAGGLRELTAAGASLWGGHTTEGTELTFGFSVTGRLDDRTPFTKGSLHAGDWLILTKPLGTATLLAAHRECRCHARWMDAMLAAMLEGNAGATRLAREFGVVAATDITGFGLAGHLLEMLEASQVSARLSISSIRLLEGFAELSAAGFRSSLDPANRQAESRLQPVDHRLSSQAAFQALFDPQTSGGLLLGLSADRAPALCDRLVAGGYALASIIGTVETSTGGACLAIDE